MKELEAGGEPQIATKKSHQAHEGSRQNKNVMKKRT